MDTETGKIYEIENDAHQQKIEKELGRKLESLTREQADLFKPLAPELRVAQLNKHLGLPAHANRSMRRVKAAQLRRAK